MDATNNNPINLPSGTIAQSHYFQTGPAASNLQEQIASEITTLTKRMEAKGYMAAKTSNVIIIGYGNTIATQGSYDNAENEILSEIPLAKHKCDENNFTNPEIIVVIPDDAYGNSINTNKIK